MSESSCDKRGHIMSPISPRCGVCGVYSSQMMLVTREVYEQTRQRLAAAEEALSELKTSIHKWKVVLVSPTADDPFSRIDCEIIDIGYSDHAIVVAAKGGRE